MNPLALYWTSYSCLAWLIFTGAPLVGDVFVDDFGRYNPGALGSQGGWSSEKVNGNSAITVAAPTTQSLLIIDGDPLSRPRATYDLGGNHEAGEFEVYVKDQPQTAAANLWRIDFFRTGSTTRNFSLIRANGNLSIEGSSGSLVSVAITTTSYDENNWNHFRIVYNEANGNASIYLNDETLPILTPSQTATDWAVGRFELSVGYNSGVGAGAEFIVSREVVPDFGTYTAGALDSQGGWSSDRVDGTSEITVLGENAGALHVYDGDASDRPRARMDLGANAAEGELNFQVHEDANTPSHDLWRIDFYSTGSFSANFSLVRRDTLLTLESSGTILTSVAISGTSYTPLDWNSFRLQFNESSNQASVYLNGEATPILTSSLTTVNWTVGRFELSVGYNSATDHGVYFRTTMPEDEVPSWRSVLYPSNWSPGYADSAGRFLHDFSYAGYDQGESAIPTITGPIYNVTLAPYSADHTGQTDATAAIQDALDDAAAAGGGVVFLPAGTYAVAPPAGETVALKLQGDGVVLRGAGTHATYLLNTETEMKGKKVIEVRPTNAAWWYNAYPSTPSANLTVDAVNGDTEVTVDNVSPFSVGDLVLVRNDPTTRFINELGMTGKWTASNLKDRALIFCRRIVSIDSGLKKLTLDVPLRYELLMVDNARVLLPPGDTIQEAGIEDLSIGMEEITGTGWGQTDYNDPTKAAYDASQSHAVVFYGAEDCWMLRVNSYLPPSNASGSHILSNGIKCDKSRFVTIQDCDWRHPQYRGGGGNGYLYTLHGSECLIINSRAIGGRHNYDFGTMQSTGNAIVGCTAREGLLASDFHMHFSVANLLDSCVLDGDFLEAKYRPFGWPEHGETTSQSVFWNTRGLDYTSSTFDLDGVTYTRERILIESRQFETGYVIGTSGSAFIIATDDDEHVEGVGKGHQLDPPSLYADQLSRRTSSP